jgi:hypothetical protein
MSLLQPLPPTFAATVAALHSVAAQIVAPARKPDNEIALEPTPGGFGTPEFEHDGKRQQIRVELAELVRAAGGDEQRTALTTLEDARGLVADLVPGGPLSGEPLGIDPVAATRLADWYAFGDSALRTVGGESVLWPEHFDIAIELGAATYGFSPGDEEHVEPYAYVLPSNPVEGELWQATGFHGAELAYADLLAARDQRGATLDFFLARKEALA